MSAASSSRPDNVHATAVVIGETGILIRGRSGRGKSALALALLELADERGLFGRLIGDDRVLIEAQSGRMLLSGASETLGLIERRVYGLERRAVERSVVARLVVDLLDEGETAPRMPEAPEEVATLGEINLKRLIFDESSRPFERARATLAALAVETTAL